MPWKTRLGVEVGHPVGGTLYFACVCVCVCVFGGVSTSAGWPSSALARPVVCRIITGRLFALVDAHHASATITVVARRCFSRRCFCCRCCTACCCSSTLLSLSLSPLALERPSNNTTLPGSFVGTTRSVAAIHWSREGRRGIGSVRTNIFPPLKTPIRCQRVVLASSFLLLFLLFIYFFLFHFPSFPSPPPFIVSVRFSLEASKVVRPVRN